MSGVSFPVPLVQSHGGEVEDASPAKYSQLWTFLQSACKIFSFVLSGHAELEDVRPNFLVFLFLDNYTNFV